MPSRSGSVNLKAPDHVPIELKAEAGPLRYLDDTILGVGPVSDHLSPDRITRWLKAFHTNPVGDRSDHVHSDLRLFVVSDTDVIQSTKCGRPPPVGDAARLRRVE